MSLPSKPELSDAALDALITRERTRVVAPLTEWHTLASALRTEGVIRPQPAAEEASYDTRYGAPFEHSTRHTPAPDDLGPPVRRNRITRWGTRVMASVVLLGSGVMIGRTSSIGENLVAPVKTIVAEATDSATAIASIKSSAQAQKVLARSERQVIRAANQYQRAAAYLAARDTTARIVGGPKVYQERLAALDEVLATTREKLQATPGDPVLAQYYQSAYGAREATLQQLGQTLPATVQISHY
jgi:hypothetical protein